MFNIDKILLEGVLFVEESKQKELLDSNYSTFLNELEKQCYLNMNNIYLSRFYESYKSYFGCELRRKYIIEKLMWDIEFGDLNWSNINRQSLPVKSYLEDEILIDCQTKLIRKNSNNHLKVLYICKRKNIEFVFDSEYFDKDEFNKRVILATCSNLCMEYFTSKLKYRSEIGV